MCEESACLVPPLTDSSHNGSAEPRVSGSAVVGGSPGSNGGGLGSSIGGQALVGFHEDALAQAAVGRAQLLLALVLGLALAADCSELVVLGFVLPAAELQLCIGPHRKNWLGSISIVAMAIGSLAWGVLGDRLGRRRALVSALSVAALFSAVAAVMPTYGTFMTARFCSGLGIAGAVPLSFSYLAEICPRATRTRYTGLLHAFWPLGGLFTALLAHLTMPSDGAQTVMDNREHWSSWHRLLLLNVVPVIACIIGLVWASESPRYLLEASREVEALAVYQRFHRLNRARTQYGLTELELPSRAAYRERPASPSKSAFSHGLDTFKEAFLRMSTAPYLRGTLLLAGLHGILGLCYAGISTYAPSLIRQLNEEAYASSTRHVYHANYSGQSFNSTLENVKYTDCLFHNVTFTHVVISHVNFIGCQFYETEFSNVKSSRTYFQNSTIKESRFIDTDLTEQHFIHCNLVNNTFLTMVSKCSLDFDYNIYLHDLYIETVAWCSTMVPALLIIGFLLGICSRPMAATGALLMAAAASIGIFFLCDYMSVLVVESLLKMLLMCALNAVTVATIEGFPCHLRCTAHGVMRCLYHVAALFAVPLYSSLVYTIQLFPAAITLAAAVFAAVLASRLQNNSKVLL